MGSSHIVPLLLLNIVNFAYQQELTAEFSNVRLPVAMDWVASYYDADDSILLFGGWNTTRQDSILLYSISTDRITQIGTLPQGSCQGSVHRGLNGDYFYLGGGSGGEIYRFNPTTNITLAVSLAPYNIWFSGTEIDANSSSVIVFGGYGNQRGIADFNLDSYQTRQRLVSLPFELDYISSVKVNNEAFIFGRPVNGAGNRGILKVDLLTMTFEYGPSDFNNVTNHFSKAVYDGRFIYVIGGYQSYNDSRRGMYQVDPISMQHVLIGVGNFPHEDDEHFYRFAPEGVYVERMHRIYFFGGFSKTPDFQYDDLIWWVDLSPLYPMPTTTTTTSTTITTTTSTTTTTTTSTTTPPPTTTDDPANWICPGDYLGPVPHPYVCHLFYICDPGHRPCLFEYPGDLVFNPDTLQCDYMHNVPGCEDGIPGRHRSYNITKQEQPDPCQTVYKLFYM